MDWIAEVVGAFDRRKETTMHYLFDNLIRTCTNIISTLSYILLSGQLSFSACITGP